MTLQNLADMDPLSL